MDFLSKSIDLIGKLFTLRDPAKANLRSEYYNKWWRLTEFQTSIHLATKKITKAWLFSFQALFGQALDVRKIEMRKTMICEEVEIGNSWENVKKHAQKRRQILNKSSLNHPKSTPMGSKIDFGALQDIILDSRRVSNTSRRLAS